MALFGAGCGETSFYCQNCIPAPAAAVEQKGGLTWRQRTKNLGCIYLQIYIAHSKGTVCALSAFRGWKGLSQLKIKDSWLIHYYLLCFHHVGTL